MALSRVDLPQPLGPDDAEQGAVAQREADVVEQHRLLDLDRDVVRDDRGRALVVVLVQVHAVEEELVPADGEPVAGGQRGPRHPPAVVVQAVAAVQVDEVVLGADLADLRVLAGDPEVGQHDVVVGVAADPDGAGRVERGDRRRATARPVPCRVGRWLPRASSCRSCRAGVCRPDRWMDPGRSADIAVVHLAGRGVRDLPRLEQPERRGPVDGRRGGGVGEQAGSGRPGWRPREPVVLRTGRPSGRPPEHLVGRCGWPAAGTRASRLSVRDGLVLHRPSPRRPAARPAAAPAAGPGWSPAPGGRSSRRRRPARPGRTRCARC